MFKPNKMEINKDKQKKEVLKSFPVLKNFTYKDKKYKKGDRIKLNVKQAEAAKKNNLI